MRAIPLLVPSHDKDAAKKLGARWNPQRRAWEWPADQDRKAVKKWLPRIYRNDLKPPHITPALVPECMWGVNLRSLLPKEQWDILRKDCYRNAGYCCQVCGARGQPPHCNEQWIFKFPFPPKPNLNRGVQYLQRLACLCAECHMVKHLGYARVTGKLQATVKHMAKLNGWTASMAEDVANIAFTEWDKRNKYDWGLNLEYLEKQHGIFVDIAEERVRSINNHFMKKIARERQSFFNED